MRHLTPPLTANMNRPPTLDLRASMKNPIRIALLFAVATAIGTLFVPNLYRSEVRILPADVKLSQSLGNLTAAAGVLGLSIPGGEGADANFVDVLNSRTVKEGLLTTEFRFHARDWYFGRYTPRQETLYEFLDVKNMDRAVKKLSEILSVSRDLKSKVISLSVETRSPELSQQVARRATEILEQFVQTKSRTRGGEKAAFAKARLAEARVEMDQAEDSLRRFLEGNRNYLDSRDPATRLRGIRLESELNLRRQLVTVLATNREQSLLEEKNDMPIVNVLDPGNLPVEKSWPSRSLIVLFVTLIAGLVSWIWPNREWIRARFSEDGDQVPVTTEE